MIKGQLILECSCGNSEVLDDNVENGLSFVMTVEAKSEWVFKCSKCEHSFNLKLRSPSYNKTAEELEVESILEEYERYLKITKPLDNESKEVDK